MKFVWSRRWDESTGSGNKLSGDLQIGGSQAE